MLNIWKKRGTAPCLNYSRRRERELFAHVERGIDDGYRFGGLLAEIMIECRARAVRQPNDASWRFLLGRSLVATGAASNGREELEAAAILDPRDPRITAHLALWYVAAFRVARGESVSIDLPRVAGPALTVDSWVFANFDEDLSPAAIAARAVQFIDATLRFSLPMSETRPLRKLRSSIQRTTVEPPRHATSIIRVSRAG